MKILRNYIIKDFISVFIFSFLILSMVMLMGNLMKVSDMIVRKGISVGDALRILSFFIPYLLGFTIPLAFLMGVLLVMGRLIADNEIIAMRVAGISLFKILNIFLILGCIFSLFLFILNDRVIPDFHYRYRSQIKNIYFKNVSALIEPGVFLEHFENYILYVADKNGNKLKNVFIYETDNKQRTTKVTFAKKGEFIVEGDILKIKLEEGFRDETISKKKMELYRLNFKVFFMDIPIQKREKVKVNKKSSDMRLAELREKIALIDAPELKGEFHKRISFSFSCLAFIILGFGISLAVKHREKSINFGIAFLTAGFYYLLFILGEALLEYRYLPPALGMWLPNIIVISIGGYLIFKHAYSR
ncbi:MAG: LptF/LptG family permease [Candidatus Omnitrophica bacterium]|nr:LptF/LptG family permease [Candidatus Omnitrophota bacterium]